MANVPDVVTPPGAEQLVFAMLGERAPDATLCPSEVARALAATAPTSEAAWRRRMPEVHATIDRLLDAGRIGLSWKGVPLARREGPYRIRLGDRDEASDS